MTKTLTIVQSPLHHWTLKKPLGPTRCSARQADVKAVVSEETAQELCGEGYFFPLPLASSPLLPSSTTAGAGYHRRTHHPMNIVAVRAVQLAYSQLHPSKHAIRAAAFAALYDVSRWPYGHRRTTGLRESRRDGWRAPGLHTVPA